MELDKSKESEEQLDARYFSSTDLELDTELDTRGVMLEKEMYCAYCMTIMGKIEHNKYRCPHCHIVFNDLTA